MLDVLSERYNILPEELESRYTLRQLELKYHFFGQKLLRDRETQQATLKLGVLEAIGIAFGGSK